MLRSSDRRATGRRPRGEAATRPTPPEGSASGFGNVDPIPFRPRGEAPASPERGGRPPPLGAELPWGLGSTDPCTTAVHMEPFSATRPSRISLEYLLLPPRSAPAAAPGGLAACPSKLAAAALLLVGAYLPGGKGRRLSAPTAGCGRHAQRHPFSGLVDSAGELLHTPWRIPTSMATVLLSVSTNAFSGL